MMCFSLTSRAARGSSASRLDSFQQLQTTAWKALAKKQAEAELIKQQQWGPRG